MKYNEKLTENILKCVLGNISFGGQVGSNYTVQELVHSTSLKTIDGMYKNTKKQLEALDGDSLYASTSSTKRTLLTLQADTLREVFAYNQHVEKTARAAAKDKVERASKVAILKTLRTEKELKALGKLSLKDLDKEIAKAEKGATSS